MNSRPRTRRPRLALLVHALRVVLVFALLLSIPSPAKIVTDGSSPPSLDQVSSLLTAADGVNPEQDAAGMWTVRDVDGTPIASVARTLPAAKNVVGYRGPTESMILFNKDLEITGVSLLQSADTEEHVDAVVKDEIFFEQFKNWPWGGPSSDTRIDAVSGATLTSLALAEGILKRIGGDRPSLFFPDPIKVDETTQWFPDATSVDESKTIAIAKDENGKAIGRLLRTGPLTDDIGGYQGPTEMLLKLSGNNLIEKIKLRKSYDNEPYVDYVRVEAGYWAIFEGKPLSELAAFDPEEAGVEGVSGATMTSLAVADTLVAAAKGAEAKLADEAKAGSAGMLAELRFGVTEIATLVVLLLAAVVSRMRLFHHRKFRTAWLLTVVIVIGLWAGNLVSLALIAGWSAEGIAWKLAPGLAAIAIIAIVAPPLSKGNPYCNHLCPHGALQQLIRPPARSRRHRHVSRRLTKWLTKIPAVTLIAAYLALVVMPSIDLSSWEPFHAYLFRIAGWTSIALAVGSLILASFIPMGYCRFGCPTGSLLDYLRRTATSDRLGAGDFIAVGLLVVAWVSRAMRI